MSVEDPGEDLPVGPMWWSAVRGASLPGKKKRKEKKISGRSFPAEGDPRVYKRRSPVRAGAVRHSEQSAGWNPRATFDSSAPTEFS